MNKYFIVPLLIAFCFTASVTQAQPVTDIAGGITSTIASYAQEMGTKLLDKQREALQNADAETIGGNGACSANPKQISTKIKTYDFVKKNILSGPESKLAPPQKDYKTALNHVQKTFFTEQIKDKDGSTYNKLSTEEINELREKRIQYLTEVGSKTLFHAMKMRELIQDDMEELKKAPESGCNVIQDIQVQNIHLFNLVKQQAAHTGLQMEALELSIARHLLAETAENTTTSDKGGLSSSGIGGIGGLLK